MQHQMMQVWCAFLLLILLSTTADGDSSVFSEAMESTLNNEAQGYLQCQPYKASFTVVIVNKTSTLLVKRYGYRSSDIVNSDNLYNVGSMTKSMLATTIGVILEKTKKEPGYTFDTQLRDILGDDERWFARRNLTYEVTLRDLLAQRLASPSYLWSITENDWTDDKESHLCPLREHKNWLRNSSYAVSAMERITGEPWRDTVRSVLFEPLGMTSSTFLGDVSDTDHLVWWPALYEITNALNETANTLTETANALNETAKALNEKTNALIETENALIETAKALIETANTLNKMANTLNEKKNQLNHTTNAWDETVKAFNEKANALNEKANALIVRANALIETANAANETENTLNERSNALNKTANVLTETSNALNKMIKASEEYRTWIRWVLAKAAVSSGNDMGKYLRCVLNKGVGDDGTQVVPSGVLDDVYKISNSAPSIPMYQDDSQPPIPKDINIGNGLAIYMGLYTGRRSVTHAGSIFGWETRLRVLPEQGLAVHVTGYGQYGIGIQSPDKKGVDILAELALDLLTGRNSHYPVDKISCPSWLRGHIWLAI